MNLATTAGGGNQVDSVGCGSGLSSANGVKNASVRRVPATGSLSEIAFHRVSLKSSLAESIIREFLLQKVFYNNLGQGQIVLELCEMPCRKLEASILILNYWAPFVLVGNVFPEPLQGFPNPK